MVWITLALGLLLLVSGADLLVRGAARLAENLGVPALVVGLTVVAFGTSAPELAVSVRAAHAGQVELAIANVVGSNIFNTLFILGVAALISPLVVSRQLIRQDVPVMIIVSAVAVAMVLDGKLERLEAALLVTALIAYTAFLFFQGRKSELALAEPRAPARTQADHPAWKNLVLVVAGLALLVIGASWLVASAVEIASALGVGEAVIGLTIVAAGTSLPEVMTSVVATLKGERDIAIGNVVGSNVFNILCVLGISGLVSPLPLLAGAQMATVDLPVMLATACLCLPLFFVGGTLNRFEGGLFLALYLSYVWYLVAIQLQLENLPILQAGIVYGLVPLVGLYVVAILVEDLRRRTHGRL